MGCRVPSWGLMLTRSLIYIVMTSATVLIMMLLSGWRSSLKTSQEALVGLKSCMVYLAALFWVPDSLTPRLLDSTVCYGLDEAFV